MHRLRALLFAACCVALPFSVAAIGCDGESGSGAGGAGGAGASLPSGASGGGTNEDGCTLAGGQCDCDGACALGTHPAPSPLLDQCPQPPPNSGACSLQCCLPADDAGSGGQAGHGGSEQGGAGAGGESSDGGLSDAPTCSSHEECGFGYICTHDCVPVECHMGQYPDTLDKPCTTAGTRCEIQDDGLGYNGLCVPFDTDCGWDSDCPFGYLCTGGQCVLAECTWGDDISGYGPRECTEQGELCLCIDDGAELHGGRGQCVSSDDECV